MNKDDFINSWASGVSLKEKIEEAFSCPPFIELSKEEIFERGKARPYSKFCTFPIEVSPEWAEFKPTQPATLNGPQPIYKRVDGPLEIKVVIPNETKFCTKCSKTLAITCFGKNRTAKDGLQSNCKSCHKEYRRVNLTKHSARKKAQMNDIQAEGIKEYGGKCACCGEQRPRFLTIDHIYNDGAKERKELNKKYGNHQKYTGKKLWALLKRLGYPKDRYQLLCFNCNVGRHINNGICPHEEERNNDTNS